MEKFIDETNTSIFQEINNVVKRGSYVVIFEDEDGKRKVDCQATLFALASELTEKANNLT